MWELFTRPVADDQLFCNIGTWFKSRFPEIRTLNLSNICEEGKLRGHPMNILSATYSTGNKQVSASNPPGVKQGTFIPDIAVSV
jgi:hypothetical protein